MLPDEDIFELRGIDRAGCVVVVRPDQYVANVLPLTATDELAAFFAQFLLAAEGHRRARAETAVRHCRQGMPRHRTTLYAMDSSEPAFAVRGEGDRGADRTRIEAG